MTTELDALALQAQKLDGDVEAQSPEAVVAGEAQAAVMSLAESNMEGMCMVLEIAVPVVSEMYPSLAAVYTPEACGRVAGALGPVLAKYGIDLSQVRGRWGEEIAAAIICFPIAKATYAAIKHDVAVKQGREAVKVAEPDPTATPAPAQNKATLMPGDFGYVEPGGVM